MTLIAGVDIGNSTTEIVIADVTAKDEQPHPLAWDRTPTAGPKGSSSSIRAALRLLERLERQIGRRVDHLAMAPLAPVTTVRWLIAPDSSAGGRLRILDCGATSVGGTGSAVGRPVLIDSAVVDMTHLPSPDLTTEPIIAVAADPLGFRATVAVIHDWLTAGVDVRAVLLAGDEAVLVSRRLPKPLPVIDGVDIPEVMACDLVAVEVGDEGVAIQQLSDPLALGRALRLDAGDLEDAALTSAAVQGRRVAVIGRQLASPSTHESLPLSATTPSRPEFICDDGRAVSAREAARWMDMDHGRVIAVRRTPTHVELVADVRIIDLAGIVRDCHLACLTPEGLALASLASASGSTALPELAERSMVEVSSEAAAARVGALTTPLASEDALVVDIGGGTIDVIAPDGTQVVHAGAGDLLTIAVEGALGISHGQAEWVKRGPCARIESPFVTAGEDGVRRFLEHPAPNGTVGWLVTPGPAGPLPFHRLLSPSEWRLLRLRLKQEVLGRGLTRAAHALGSEVTHGSTVIAVGGPVGDSEISQALRDAFPGCRPARADVAGRLGHRYAVALGLIVLASRA